MLTVALPPVIPGTVGHPLEAVSAHVSISLSLLLIIAAGAFAVLDSALRFRRAGGGPVLAILELILGLLLVVSRLTILQPYVSTTIPVLALAIGLAIVLFIQLLIKNTRKNGTVWLTIFTLALAVGAAVVVFLRIH